MERWEGALLATSFLIEEIFYVLMSFKNAGARSMIEQKT